MLLRRPLSPDALPLLRLSRAQRSILWEFVWQPACPPTIVQRAQIILAAADGVGKRDIAQRLDLPMVTVIYWHMRWSGAAPYLATLETASAADRTLLRWAITTLLADTPDGQEVTSTTMGGFRPVITAASIPPASNDVVVSQALSSVAPRVRPGVWAGLLARVWQALVCARQCALGSALVYLVAISLAEIVTVLINPGWGGGAYFAILGLLLIHSTSAQRAEEADFLLTLIAVPMIRIVSLGLPLAHFSQQWQYALTSLPLYIMCIVMLRVIPLSPGVVGLRLPSWHHWPVTILVASSGIVFGAAEYTILHPEPLVASLALGVTVGPAIILAVGTGFIEEFIFRGILQTTAMQAFGRARGIAFISLLSGALYLSHRSPADVLFLIGVAAFFATVACWTRTLIGVAIAHGVMNIMIFIILPLRP